jgi:hypothetical protein
VENKKYWYQAALLITTMEYWLFKERTSPATFQIMHCTVRGYRNTAFCLVDMALHKRTWPRKRRTSLASGYSRKLAAKCYSSIMQGSWKTSTNPQFFKAVIKILGTLFSSCTIYSIWTVSVEISQGVKKMSGSVTSGGLLQSLPHTYTVMNHQKCEVFLSMQHTFTNVN